MKIKLLHIYHSFQDDILFHLFSKLFDSVLLELNLNFSIDKIQLVVQKEV